MSEKAEHATARPDGSSVQRTRRQRRPAGASPPLPHPATITTTAWLLLLAIPVGGAVAFMPRARLVDHIKSTEGLALCGRGAAWPG